MILLKEEIAQQLNQDDELLIAVLQTIKQIDSSFSIKIITKLYRQLRENYTQGETYDRLMLITGHTTLSALQQYLRDTDAELPQDYSDFL